MSKVAKSFICRGCLNPVTSAGRASVDIGASAKLELVDKFCYLGDMLSVDGLIEVYTLAYYYCHPSHFYVHTTMRKSLTIALLTHFTLIVIGMSVSLFDCLSCLWISHK